MTDSKSLHAQSRLHPETHQRGAEKLARIPVKVVPTETPLRKPAWIRIRTVTGENATRVKQLLRERKLHTVCEEAACPNLNECFSHGTATFMILGDLCTRRCPFCDVAHGRPASPDPDEPEQLAQSIQTLGLRYVVITSVNRDDLRDGGSAHFAACIQAVRAASPTTRIEILTPDFRGRAAVAIETLKNQPPDVFNHNLETVPRLYAPVRPGADYRISLELLRSVKAALPEVPTKSGLMLGVGEEFEEIVDVMRDLRDHGCEMLTLGQYLQPSRAHLPVQRYVPPEEFDRLGAIATELGFTSVASAPMVRSSYHADQQAAQLLAPRPDDTVTPGSGT